MKLKLLSLCIFLGISVSHASDLSRNVGAIERLQRAIKSLNQDSPFVFFNLSLSQEESMALERMEVKFPEVYNNLGNLETLPIEVTTYIKSLGNENEKTIETVSKLIQRIIHDCVQASGKETAWVTLRASQANSHFDLARWHIDGYYYQPHCDQYKFAITLKGAGTLFYKLPKQMTEQFFTLLQEDNRQALAEILNDSRLVMQGKADQGAIFIVGSDDAAVHSEPPINEERLFISILPGSKKQIIEWKQNGFKGY
ncbi:MAG: hypothetical protein K0R76_110 [Alphaproteobacteria bacterium]|jgi:hypothetical protein|nr:hypothetical protein [Alphaproteobacteria bacterium]